MVNYNGKYCLNNNKTIYAFNCIFPKYYFYSRGIDKKIFFRMLIHNCYLQITKNKSLFIMKICQISNETTINNTCIPFL